MEMQPPPVKRMALEHRIPVAQPEKIKNNFEFRTQLEDIQPEAILVVAYGRIIPQWMLDLPPLGNINLHGSLLPKYRGAAPIQWAVASGEYLTGVTTMRLDAGLDTGDMLLAKVVPIGQEETAVDVYECLAATGAELMVETLCGLADGSLFCQPQDHSLATLAPILKREDGRIEFTRTAQNVYDRWRGFQPWPGAHTTLRGRKLIVHKMHVARHTTSGEPGTLAVQGDAITVACADGTAIGLNEIQTEGKRRMSAAEFLNGYQIRSGERLGI
jgi:methionyl-tRNA formyltransferase